MNIADQWNFKRLYSIKELFDRGNLLVIAVKGIQKRHALTGSALFPEVT
jgi:hypothetical protein